MTFKINECSKRYSCFPSLCSALLVLVQAHSVPSMVPMQEALRYSAASPISNWIDVYIKYYAAL